jgi:hypothetical protein
MASQWTSVVAEPVMAVNYSNSTGEYVAETVLSISVWSVAM